MRLIKVQTKGVTALRIEQALSEGQVLTLNLRLVLNQGHFPSPGRFLILTLVLTLVQLLIRNQYRFLILDQHRFSSLSSFILILSQLIITTIRTTKMEDFTQQFLEALRG